MGAIDSAGESLSGGGRPTSHAVEAGRSNVSATISEAPAGSPGLLTKAIVKAVGPLTPEGKLSGGSDQAHSIMKTLAGFDQASRPSREPGPNDYDAYGNLTDEYMRETSKQRNSFSGATWGKPEKPEDEEDLPPTTT